MRRSGFDMDISGYVMNDNMYSMANMYARQNTLDYINKQRKKKGFLSNMLAGDYFYAPKGASMAQSVSGN